MHTKKIKQENKIVAKDRHTSQLKNKGIFKKNTGKQRYTKQQKTQANKGTQNNRKTQAHKTTANRSIQNSAKYRQAYKTTQKQRQSHQTAEKHVHTKQQKNTGTQNNSKSQHTKQCQIQTGIQNNLETETVTSNNRETCAHKTVEKRRQAQKRKHTHQSNVKIYIVIPIDLRFNRKTKVHKTREYMETPKTAKKYIKAYRTTEHCVEIHKTTVKHSKGSVR